MFVFKRAPRQSLSDLEKFLREVGDEPIVWLEREVKSWGEFSYAELEELILSGRAADLIDWQSRYAKVVNEKFNPLWLAAIARASYNSTRGKITIDDSDPRVKEFLRTRAADLIRDLSDESRRAIANVILHGQSEHLAPKEIARQIRPLIGLKARQAQANVNYRQRVFNRLIDNGLSVDAANKRADRSAVKYASKQHRQRAETIVHTELARAYNQGAHDGILSAVQAKLMNHCEMVWTTAGTNRVCGRCLELKDTVVGHTNEVGVQLPPLHPRCRCTISYREMTDKPTTAPRTHDRGLGAGNINTTTTEGNPPKLIDKLESVTSAAIQKTLERYEAQIVQASVEHAIIITAKGEVWHCNGDVHGIPIHYFEQLSAQLEGAHVTHNHPLGADENDHTFSNDDKRLFVYFKLARLRGIDELFLYEFNRNASNNILDGHDLYEIYDMGLDFNDHHVATLLWALTNGFGYWRESR